VETISRFAWILRALLLVCLCLIAVVQAEGPQDAKLTIFVPGAKGGGYDITAAAVKRTMVAEGLFPQVELIRSPGAGGLVALAQFAERDATASRAVIVGGRSILGASKFNRSEVSLDDVRGIARLNTIALVVAVANDGPIQSFADLAIAMRENPKVVKWGGGSSGSVDEQLAMEIASALGISAQDLSYSAAPGGGEQIAQDLLVGESVVAISSYEEFAGSIADGIIKPVAVSTAERIKGVDAPTLIELGLDLQFRDWKGVFASPALPDAQFTELEEIFAAMSRSPVWQESLDSLGWQDGYLGAAEFDDFVQLEIARIAAQDNQAVENPGAFDQLRDVIARANRWIWIAGGVLLLLLGWLAFQHLRDRRTEAELRLSLDAVSEEKLRVSEELERRLSETTGRIGAEFNNWNLSDAEIDVGWLILKGFSFQEIADNRRTSERTVRQQAQSIYNKAGLSGRSELSAYFLEDFFESDVT